MLEGRHRRKYLGESLVCNLLDDSVRMDIWDILGVDDMDSRLGRLSKREAGGRGGPPEVYESDDGTALAG